MQTSPLVAGAAVAVMILGVIAVAAVTGVLPGAPWHKQVLPSTDAAESVRSVDCPVCGTVESIRTVEVRDETGGSHGGATAGAAIGKDGSTAIATDGTAASGNETETNVKKRYAYRVTVRMGDGSYRTVSLSSPPTLAVGDRVRVVEGKLVRA